MKTFKKFHKIEEEPVNVTGPNIAGKDIPFFDKIMKRQKFMNIKVFDVTPEDFDRSRFGKNRYERMKRFFNNIKSGIGRKVHEFSKKFPNHGIIVRNEKSKSMMFLKKPKKK